MREGLAKGGVRQGRGELLAGWLQNIIQISMGNSKSLYSKQDLLYYHIEKNQIVEVSHLLDQNAPLINQPLSKDAHHTPLMRAAYNSNIQLIQLLLSRKADPNIITPKGETALTIAVKRNHLKAVELLIEGGADIAHVSKIGLRLIEYAILGGFYEIASTIYGRLSREERQCIQDPKTYSQLGKKYSYRYVNYEMLLEGLVLNKSPEEMPNFLKKEKKKLVDPVVDPRETWKQWLKRQLDWKDAPLVERTDLPENLQPQNRLLGKVHHYTNNFMSTHLSQKTTLRPKQNQQGGSEMGELNTNSLGSKKEWTGEKMKYETQSQA